LLQKCYRTDLLGSVTASRSTSVAAFRLIALSSPMIRFRFGKDVAIPTKFRFNSTTGNKPRTIKQNSLARLQSSGVVVGRTINVEYFTVVTPGRTR